LTPGKTTMRVTCLAGIVLVLGSFILDFVNADASSPFEAPGRSSGEFLREVLEPDNQVADDHEKSICRPTGQIHDACLDYESVEKMNDHDIFERLDNLRKTRYFRYFLVDLFKECPFWNDDGLCMNRACTVERMNETDMPEEFRSYRLSQLERSNDDHEQGSMASGENPTDFCQLDDDNPNGDAIFVDLMKNPERFTGYAGPSANRVWRSIYEENCFGGVKWTEPPRPVSSGGTGFISQNQVINAVKGIPYTLMNPQANDGGSLENLIDSVKAPTDPAAMEQCLEKRVFYRVISGLHASISIHICNEYLDPETMTWAPNLECFMTRISQHPERLQNVYFDYVLLMRALSKASEYLEKVGLRDSDRITDKESREQLMGLLEAARSDQASFDEHKLFTLNDDPVHNQEVLTLKEDFRLHYRNISRIMDCVGCDKCRLWGKVQVTGIGTALKLLFAFEASDKEYVCITYTRHHVQLRRNELVALINTAHRVSESVRIAEGLTPDSCGGNVPRHISKFPQRG